MDVVKTICSGDCTFWLQTDGLGRHCYNVVKETKYKYHVYSVDKNGTKSKIGELYRYEPYPFHRTCEEYGSDKLVLIDSFSTYVIYYGHSEKYFDFELVDAGDLKEKEITTEMWDKAIKELHDIIATEWSKTDKVNYKIISDASNSLYHISCGIRTELLFNSIMHFISANTHE